MNKKLREMLENINNKKAEARELLNKGDRDGAEKLRDEIKNLEKDFDIAKDLFEDAQKVIENKKPEPKTEKTPVADFCNVLRTRRIDNVVTVSVDEDGGFTVPKDIQTKINEYRESKDDLTKLVTVEPIKTMEGARTFKTRAQQTGFIEVDELAEIPEKATPKFTRLGYKAKKYAGFMRTSNEAIKDSDTNVVQFLTKWVGDESRVTRNKLVLTTLGTKAKTAIDDVDGIKKAMNVTLDPAFAATTEVVTNQDGFNWLDTLKDAEGKYLLQPSITSPSGKQLFGKNVTVISNKDLPSVTNKAPLIIGDLKEAVVIFDRENLSIKASDEAHDSFITDSTLLRAIERLDVKMRDAEAFVYGEIGLAVSTQGE
ncbi:phage capsid protein [Halalkalibacter wakoensis JCM 9140]|uniref:Phage capsid protein n=1 Tax=Halalkalibacter wakoensis JCM 9140 TaxID=1236970 RepID=W4Q4V5_9BACI|nr:phage major capsid protein [Halalkalibacter wakoensis]GAE27022.1 phage capsid protein [Halalkalibacter wakoensis JCM 9140]